MDPLDIFETLESDVSDSAHMAHHKINLLARLLIEKGIITQDDLQEAMDQAADTDEGSDEEEVGNTLES